MSWEEEVLEDRYPNQATKSTASPKTTLVDTSLEIFYFSIHYQTEMSVEITANFFQ